MDRRTFLNEIQPQALQLCLNTWLDLEVHIHSQLSLEVHAARLLSGSTVYYKTGKCHNTAENNIYIHTHMLPLYAMFIDLE